MYKRETTICDSKGLSSRTATIFVQEANKYKSNIWINQSERRVNAKSFLGILSIGLISGDKIAIISDGIDEKSAVDNLVQLIESNFEG